MKIKYFFIVFIISIFNIGFLFNAISDELPKPDEGKSKTTDSVTTDLTVPSSPAFAILGVSPEDVIRPDTPKALGCALLNGLDSNGHMQTGIAIETCPYYLFTWKTTTLGDYRRNLITRLMDRLQLSIATTKGNDKDDKSVKLAMGIRLAIFDDADPRSALDLDTYDSTLKEAYDAYHKAFTDLNIAKRDQIKAEDALSEAIDKKIPTQDLSDKVKQAKETVAKKEEEFSKAYDKYSTLLATTWAKTLKDWARSNWNASNLTIGAAISLFDEKGELSGLKESGYAVYATGSYGINYYNIDSDGKKIKIPLAQLLLHVRYQTDMELPDQLVEGKFYAADVMLVGSQLRIGGPNLNDFIGNDNLIILGEYDYKKLFFDKKADEEWHKWAFGLEYKISDSTTMSITLGEETGKPKAGTFTIGSLRWALK